MFDLQCGLNYTGWCGKTKIIGLKKRLTTVDRLGLGIAKRSGTDQEGMGQDGPIVSGIVR